MAFEIIWESGGAYKRFFDHVTDDELMLSVQQIESDARFDGMRYVINDFLNVASFSISPARLRVIAAIDGAAALTNPHIRIAIVTRNPEIRALAEQYAESPLTVYPTRLFTTSEAARSWL